MIVAFGGYRVKFITISLNKAMDAVYPPGLLTNIILVVWPQSHFALGLFPNQNKGVPVTRAIL